MSSDGDSPGNRPLLGATLLRLPPQLRERASIVSHGDAHAAGLRGEFVLYWAHHALRVDENPSLEVAAELSTRLGLPLLVFAGLALPEPRASDRHATFVLEGLRDFARDLSRLGVPFACSLASLPGMMASLDRLAARAALVVTDDMPAQPFPDWTASVVRRTGRATVAVDAACVVPMNLVDGVFDRAFAFREATARLRDERVARAWPAPAWHGRAWPMVEHGEREIDWDRADIPALVAGLPLDHAVCAVADTPGGSVAADARWRAFRDARLAGYARDRDDATLPGVSRMSAYLHHGMISPMRLAREASNTGGEGAAKYLDELLVWRELAYHWCRHMPEHATLAALPAWARRTLERHRADGRATLSCERLARGRTGDELWDLAQRSLLAHGELHNNLRMTWGKAVPAWCATPESALATLIDLNNRHALDGGDPASYGGLLWCLGLFDRAFSPETPVLGAVRPRTTDGHRARLDLAAYRSIALRRAHPLRVAVIGAGVSGLACARQLSDHCIDAVVFEKSRGSGGRIATRRGDAGAFDHGAQYCTARTRDFARMLASWEKEGVVAPWKGRFAEIGAHGVSPVETAGRWVGTPSMSSLCGHLAHGLEIRTRTRVARIVADGPRWRLHGADDEGNALELGEFDVVLSSAPAPQTAALVGAVAPSIASVASRISMRATWSLMLGARERLALPFDHAEVLPGFAEVGESLAWISRISAKPGRACDGVDRWTVLARPEWSEERLERDASEMGAAISAEFERLVRALGVAWTPPVHAVAHRWRFALASGDDGPKALYDPSLGVGACGDWLHGTRVEDAYLSGVALAARVIGAGSQRLRASGSARQATAARA